MLACGVVCGIRHNDEYALPVNELHNDLSTNHRDAEILEARFLVQQHLEIYNMFKEKLIEMRFFICASQLENFKSLP